MEVHPPSPAVGAPSWSAPVESNVLLQEKQLKLRDDRETNIYKKLNMAEPPNLMPPKSTYLPLDTKYSREDTKLRSSIEHTPRENPKSTFFYQDHKWENKAYIIINYFLHHFSCNIKVQYLLL